VVSDGSSSVWVIINGFTKIALFIPLKDEDKTATDLVRICLKDVWKFHGLPSNIVSDRNSRFTSVFCCMSAEALAIRLKMSLPFHPQMDGQKERVNQMLECYLQNYCKYKEDN
jgi:hypothetical protein